MTRGKPGRRTEKGWAICVYSPDAMMSGLVDDLDRFLSDRTGLVLEASELRIHDAASISGFYAISGSTSGAHWPLVVRLFEGRTVRIGRRSAEPTSELQSLMRIQYAVFCLTKNNT